MAALHCPQKRCEHHDIPLNTRAFEAIGFPGRTALDFNVALKSELFELQAMKL
jgi:hypothetical protein